jgi:hypothetical protein
MAKMGAAARSKFEARYTSGLNHDILIQIYESAIEQRKADALKG